MVVVVVVMVMVAMAEERGERSRGVVDLRAVKADERGYPQPAGGHCLQRREMERGESQDEQNNHENTKKHTRIQCIKKTETLKN